jgi:hypothetical protein
MESEGAYYYFNNTKSMFVMSVWLGQSVCCSINDMSGRVLFSSLFGLVDEMNVAA